MMDAENEKEMVMSYYLIRCYVDGKYWFSNGEGRKFVDNYDKAKRFETMSKAQAHIFVYGITRADIVGVVKSENEITL